MNTVVARYLEAAASGDARAVADCFVPDGTVVDEGNTYVGRAAIVEWREKAATQWTYTTSITGESAVGSDGYRVQAHLEGDFPGGVADLEFEFVLRGELVSSLVIG